MRRPAAIALALGLLLALPGSLGAQRGPATETYRVLRGGSWINYPFPLRSTYRNYGAPDYRNYFAGFRCAKGS